MNQFREVLSEHKAAVCLALLASMIVALPQVYFRFEHRNDGLYQGIELLPDSPWSARVREIQDGHPNFGNIYQKDGKDNPYLLQPLGSMAVGYMGKMFSLDINNTLLLSRLVFSFLVFLLIYCFVFLLSRDKLAALSIAAVLVLADSILSYSGLLQILHGMSPDNFLRMARPVNPAMIYLLLFGFLISFWRFYQQKNYQWGVISAVLLGLNFYNYFYSWTFLYAFGSLLVLFFLVKKNWREAIRIVSVFAGALLVAIPYGLNLYRATLHAAYQGTSAQFGVILTHAPLFIGFSATAALIIFLYKFPKEDKEKYLFGLALLLAPILTLNQQIITGKILESSHYHWFFHKPIAVIFVLLVIFHLLARQELTFYRKTLATLIIAISIFTGVFTQVTSYFYDKRDGGDIAIERQEYGPVMEWLNTNARKEAVVLGNNETSHLIVIYTPLNVFYHRAAMYSLSATKERLLDTVFSFYRLRGVGLKEAQEVFFAERGYLSWNIYGEYYRQTLGSYEATPDEPITEIVALYKETLSIPTSEWLKRVWAKYEVEYIVWDKKVDPLWRLDQYLFLEKEAEFENLVIYRFKT